VLVVIPLPNIVGGVVVVALACIVARLSLLTQYIDRKPGQDSTKKQEERKNGISGWHFIYPRNVVL
jgi:hypothetical protein